MTNRGRPVATAPRGRVTLQEAAELAGVSYSLVYRRVAAGYVPSEKDDSGVVTIARRDVQLIKPREPADDNRRAVMLRPSLERYAAWERAAGDKPVSVWLVYFTGLPSTADYNIYMAQRSTTSQPFGAPIAVTQVNTVANDGSASVSSDGLMLFFGSARVSGQGFHLYLSTRTSRVGQFGAPSEVANVNSATVTDSDGQPFVTADGQELWFASNRRGVGGNDIYRAV